MPSGTSSGAVHHEGDGYIGYRTGQKEVPVRLALDFHAARARENRLRDGNVLCGGMNEELEILRVRAGRLHGELYGFAHLHNQGLVELHEVAIRKTAVRIAPRVAGSEHQVVFSGRQMQNSTLSGVDEYRHGGDGGPGLSNDQQKWIGVVVLQGDFGIARAVSTQTILRENGDAAVGGQSVFAWMRCFSIIGDAVQAGSAEFLWLHPALCSPNAKQNRQGDDEHVASQAAFIFFYFIRDGGCLPLGMCGCIGVYRVA